MAENLSVAIRPNQNWSGGGSAYITVKNIGSTKLTGWKIVIKPTNFDIVNLYNLLLTRTTDGLEIGPQSWNPSLGAGDSVESGFQYSGTSPLLQFEVLKGSPASNTQQPTTPSPSLDLLSHGKKIFAYFSEWSIYDRGFSVSQIPAEKVTHIMYAFMFANPSQADFNLLKANYAFPPIPYRAPPQVPEGALVYHDEAAALPNIAALRQLRSRYPHLKLIMSVGGWTLSWNLSKIAADATLTRNFVQSLTDFIVREQFDGVDFDWEFVGVKGQSYNYVNATEDPRNFANLLNETRKAFDARSPTKHLEITAATGANPAVIANYVLAEPYIDYLLLMTYDYAGGWGDGGHHTALYENSNNGGLMPSDWCASGAIKHAKQAGYAPEKLCVGVAMYARGWAGLQTGVQGRLPIYSKSLAGPGKTYSGAAGESGLTSWRHLKPLIGQNGLKEYYDEVAKASFVHNSSTGETWTYDDEQSVALKAQYVLDNELAGLLFWELSDDIRNGPGLLDAVLDTLQKGTVEKPTEEVPGEEEEPAEEVPGEEEKPAEEVPGEEEKPAEEVPAEEEKPAEEVPAEEENPTEEVPEEDEKPTEEVPGEEEKPAEEPSKKASITITLANNSGVDFILHDGDTYSFSLYQ